ncbi:hypothetical protein QZH41_016081, partial [Actinostola sp. cb2023]
MADKVDDVAKVRHVVGCHEKRAFQVFKELKEYDELLDVTLKVDDKEIKAHRIVLAACSPYFRAMLTAGFAETFMSTISLRDCNPESVQHMIDYFYSCKLTITQDNIEGILSTASLFEIPEVVQECGEFMVEEIQLDNCLGIQSLASQYSLTSLKSKVDNFISWKFMNLCVEEEFTLIPSRQLDQIISQDSLHINGEDDVFEALMAWYQEDESRIHKHKVETFDMETGVCTEVLGIAETSGTAIAVNNDLYLLVGGGLMVDKYNPKKNCWSEEKQKGKEMKVHRKSKDLALSLNFKL